MDQEELKSYLGHLVDKNISNEESDALRKKLEEQDETGNTTEFDVELIEALKRNKRSKDLEKVFEENYAKFKRHNGSIFSLTRGQIIKIAAILILIITTYLAISYHFKNTDDQTPVAQSNLKLKFIKIGSATTQMRNISNRNANSDDLSNPLSCESEFYLANKNFSKIVECYDNLPQDSLDWKDCYFLGYSLMQDTLFDSWRKGKLLLERSLELLPEKLGNSNPILPENLEMNLLKAMEITNDGKFFNYLQQLVQKEPKSPYYQVYKPIYDSLSTSMD